MRTLRNSNTCNIEVALLSEILYPSSTYLVAVTSHASQRWLNAAFILSMWGKCPGSQQQHPVDHTEKCHVILLHKVKIYMLWGFISVDMQWSLLMWSAMSKQSWYPLSWWLSLPQSSGIDAIGNIMITLFAYTVALKASESLLYWGGSRFLQNISNHLPSYTASHPRGP
jgi:hypothetical protein